MTKKFFITTDMTADFPSDIQSECFDVIPMSYLLDGTLYDGIETPYLTSKQFYEKLKGGANSKTSLITFEQAKAFFEPILKGGNDVLHISFSSALSGSFQSVKSATDELGKKYPERKISVVDSKCASLGEGMLVYLVLRERDNGKTFDECLRYAETEKEHLVHLFTVDDMMHLYRGGRVSRGTAIIGNAIQIKPILIVDEKGKLVPTDKKLGKRIALRCMFEKLLETAVFDEKSAVFIGHAEALSDAEWLAKKVTEKTSVKTVIISEIGPVIGTHVGAGMVSIFYLGKDKNVGKFAPC